MLCADDFGLTRAINKAIVNLVKAGRLNAVSCMSVGRHLTDDSTDLLQAAREAPHKVEIGLHLTFTAYEPLSDMPRFAPGGAFTSIFSLLLKTHMGIAKDEEVRDEVKRQWDRFIEVFGRPPDFVDGHQHAHLLPIIRTHVIEHVKQVGGGNVWLRLCRTTGQGLKTPKGLLIAGLSARVAAKVVRANIPTNDFFYGFNSFDQSQDFRGLMQHWFSQVKSGGGWAIIMCHPGIAMVPDGDVYDGIAHRRIDEFDYLSGDRFIEDLKANGLTFDQD